MVLGRAEGTVKSQISRGLRELYPAAENTDNRGRPWTDVELLSGDLSVFGGPTRLAYHGVPRTLPNTADPALGLPDGRWNVTLRESGHSDR